MRQSISVQSLLEMLKMLTAAAEGQTGLCVRD